MLVADYHHITGIVHCQVALVDLLVAVAVEVTNMGGKTYDGELCVNGGKSAEIADPLTGEITPLESTIDGGVLKMNIRLKPYAAFAYIITA